MVPHPAGRALVSLRQDQKGNAHEETRGGTGARAGLWPSTGRCSACLVSARAGGRCLRGAALSDAASAGEDVPTQVVVAVRYSLWRPEFARLPPERFYAEERLAEKAFLFEHVTCRSMELQA